MCELRKLWQQEEENAELKKLVPDLSLDKQMLQDVKKKSCEAGPQKGDGLGGKLYEIINQQIPIIGVAKNSFHANHTTVKEVYRDERSKPLYVSAIGIDLDEVIESIEGMKGRFRIPDILEILDSYTKS